MATYDKNKDYSAAIQAAKAAGQDTTSLEAERAAKIADVYGGKEPNMTGSDKTYSQLAAAAAGGNSASQRDIDNAVLAQAGGTLYGSDGSAVVHNAGGSWSSGTDYAALARAYAEQASKTAAGVDWDYVDDLLGRRQDKMNATGSAGNGLSNLALWNGLRTQYAGGAVPLSDTAAAAASGNQRARESLAGYYAAGSGGLTGAGAGFGAGGGMGDDAEAYLRALYAANERAALSALEEAYLQNTQALSDSGAEITAQYRAAKNEAVGQAAIDQKIWNELAAANGLNTGTAGQAALTRSAVTRGTLGALSAGEASALADNDLALWQLERGYRRDAAQAAAENESALAAALYKEYVRRAEAQAKAGQTAQEQANWAAEQAAKAKAAALAQSNWEREFARKLANL